MTAEEEPHALTGHGQEHLPSLSLVQIFFRLSLIVAVTVTNPSSSQPNS